MIPTANFMVFSGASESWRATINQNGGHDHDRSSSSPRGQTEPVGARPQGEDDKDNLEPLEKAPLKATVKPTASLGPLRDLRHPPSGTSLLGDGASPSLTRPWSTRRWRPRREGPYCRWLEGPPCGATEGREPVSSPPMTTRRTSIGTRWISGTPTPATMTANTARAATTPSAADRQPREVPAASTIVSASTASTALAPKTANARTMAEELIWPTPWRRVHRPANSTPLPDCRAPCLPSRQGTPHSGTPSSLPAQWSAPRRRPVQTGRLEDAGHLVTLGSYDGVLVTTPRRPRRSPSRPLGSRGNREHEMHGAWSNHDVNVAILSGGHPPLCLYGTDAGSA